MTNQQVARNTLLAAVMLASAATVAAMTDKNPPAPPVVPLVAIEGRYAVAGIIEDDSKTAYTGTATIIKLRNGYMVAWLFDNGNSTKGVGYREGRGHLVVGDGSGVHSYDIDQTGGKLKLVGRWSQLPGDGTETLTFLAPLKSSE